MSDVLGGFMLSLWSRARVGAVASLIAWTIVGVSLPVSPDALAGRLARDLAPADPVASLTADQRQAAQALGKARRLVDAGKTEEAARALAQVKGVPALEGYRRWVEVRLLMSQGKAREAHALASKETGANAGDALRAALGVLQGEALAMGGDEKGAELAWNEVLGAPGAEDEAVRNSIQLQVVASRQRTGSLEAGIDPRVLLDQTFPDVVVATSEIPIAAMPPPVLVERGDAALSAGHTTRAIELYDAAIAGKLDAKQKLHAKKQRGHALFRAREYSQAVAAFKALLPDLEARFWGARSLARSGDIDGSLVEFEVVAKGSNEELASWALFLMGTIYEDRDESDLAIGAFGRAAQFERFPKRARKALWRKGWAEYRRGSYADARKDFAALIDRAEEPLDALRPRYWAARAAILSGDESWGKQELDKLGREYPLTYYGWRAQERLALDEAAILETKRKIAAGTRRVDDVAIERAALLIEADLDDLARDELRFAARRARGLDDRTRVGVLLARVGDYHRASRLVVTAYSNSLAQGIRSGRETLWWLSWPPAYRDMIDEVFPTDASIEPELVQAIMREESHYQTDARSGVGALGLLQLMPSTAAQLAKKGGLESFEAEDLFDPKTNITLGAAYLSELGTKFDGRMSAAIGSYNAGPRKVRGWLRGDAGKLEDDVWVENIPYDQTRSYVKRVLRSLHVYKSFYR